MKQLKISNALVHKYLSGIRYEVMILLYQFNRRTYQDLKVIRLLQDLVKQTFKSWVFLKIYLFNKRMFNKPYGVLHIFRPKTHLNFLFLIHSPSAVDQSMSMLKSVIKDQL